MVSYRQVTDLSPLLSLLDWLGILCSCFGEIHQVRRPLSHGDSNPRPHLIDNLGPRDGLRESFLDFVDSPRCCASEGPTMIGKPDEVFGDADDDEDDGNAENEEREDMFHGQFLLGSKILTEVELESPVAEGKVVATPIRTPRRSLDRIFLPRNGELLSDSSHSSTVDVRKSHGSSYYSITSDSQLDLAQVCALESDMSNESAALFPSRNAELSPFTSKSVLSAHEEGDPCTENYHSGLPCSAAQSHKSDKGRSLFVSMFSCNLGVHQLSSDHDRLSTVGKPSLLLQGEQNKIGLSKNKHRMVMELSAPEYSINNVFSKEEKVSRHCHWRESEKCRNSEIEKFYVPAGSLPDCLPSNFLAARSPKKSSHKQSRARSLTDQDFTELKGCIDLGFVFPPDHVLDLSETLPALEVCYAVAHGAISPAKNTEDSMPPSPCSPPVSPWRIASPGDQPQQVKARLRHWAQAVALNVRQPC